MIRALTFASHIGDGRFTQINESNIIYFLTTAIVIVLIGVVLKSLWTKKIVKK